MAKREYTIRQNGKTVFSIVVDIDTDKYDDYQWDSKTGLVTAVDVTDAARKRVIIPYTGNGTGTLEPGPFEATGITKMDYNFWYY